MQKNPFIFPVFWLLGLFFDISDGMVARITKQTSASGSFYDHISDQVREELRQLNEAGFLESRKNGRQILYQANQKHSLFKELQSMVQKALGMDRILDSILERLGNLEEAYLIDDYAEGKDTGIIDLVLVGDIDQENLTDLVHKTERYIDRKIRTLVLKSDEMKKMQPNLKKRPLLRLWNNQST
jgi:hypothetical protein